MAVPSRVIEHFGGVLCGASLLKFEVSTRNAHMFHTVNLIGLKWCIHLSRKSLLIVQLLGECHCWWTKDSPRAHVAKSTVDTRLICSVWRASKFSVFKSDWSCNSVGLLHHPFWHQLVLRHILGKSDLKWCIHLSRSLFLYYVPIISFVKFLPCSLYIHHWLLYPICQYLRNTHAYGPYWPRTCKMQIEHSGLTFSSFLWEP